jgi:hypothetical protein
MNREEWNSSNDAYAMLMYMKDIGHPAFLNENRILKKYLLQCCKMYKKYQPDEVTLDCIKSAKYFIENRATQKMGRLPLNSAKTSLREFGTLVWRSEGIAFGVEDIAYKVFGEHSFRYDENYSKGKKLAQICRGLNPRDTKKFLVNVAYFINSVMDFCMWTENSIPSKNYGYLLSAKLLRRYFVYRPMFTGTV